MSQFVRHAGQNFGLGTALLECVLLLLTVGNLVVHALRHVAEGVGVEDAVGLSPLCLDEVRNLAAEPAGHEFQIVFRVVMRVEADDDRRARCGFCIDVALRRAGKQ